MKLTGSHKNSWWHICIYIYIEIYNNLDNCIHEFSIYRIIVQYVVPISVSQDIKNEKRQQVHTNTTKNVYVTKTKKK